MTFDELSLHEAVCEVYPMIDNPRSELWSRPPRSAELYHLIHSRLPVDVHFNLEQMLQAWSKYGKAANLDLNVEMKKSELIALVARAHGRRCFYAGRGRGECSNVVALDRIIPGSLGGQYTVENCMIACSFHNGQRSDRLIEDYLS